MKLYYIYEIRNKINNKVYFGRTINYKGRWYNHINSSKGEKLCKYPINFALKKYGENNFNFYILSVFDNKEQADKEEIRLISSVEQKYKYNVATGGEGGNFLTQGYIEQNIYAIKPERYEEFRKYVEEGKIIKELEGLMGVSYGAVKNCADRLGLTIHRNMSLWGEAKPEPSRAKYTPEESSKIWSETCTKNNKNRGISEKLKKEVIVMYFEKHIFAKDISEKLNISKGSVRATTDKHYNQMDEYERNKMKKEKASIVRSGERNSRYIDGRRLRQVA